MYCVKCGKEISDQAIVCVHCGCAVNNSAKPKETQNCDSENFQKKVNFIALISFVAWNFLYILFFNIGNLYDSFDVISTLLDMLFLGGVITSFVLVCKYNLKQLFTKYIHILILGAYAVDCFLVGLISLL